MNNMRKCQLSQIPITQSLKFHEYRKGGLDINYLNANIHVKFKALKKKSYF